MNSIITGLLEAGHQVKILAVNSEKFHVKESDIPEEYKRKTGIELINVDLRVKPAKAFLNLFTKKSAFRFQRLQKQDNRSAETRAF